MLDLKHPDAPDSALKLKPRRLHHSGFVTHDAAKTVDFYSRVLGMDLVSTVMDDRVPSTGDPFPYLHLFFQMGDGATLAFFESPSIPPPAAASHPAYDVFNHIALAANSKAEVDAWTNKLRDHGINVLGPINHGIIYSIYFHDPNGNRLELTVDLETSWLERGKEARIDFEAWEAAKKRAASAGADVATALTQLIRSKHQEMKDRGIKLASDLHPD